MNHFCFVAVSGSVVNDTWVSCFVGKFCQLLSISRLMLVDHCHLNVMLSSDFRTIVLYLSLPLVNLAWQISFGVRDKRIPLVYH
jgi:hypothetical protein